jgi:hypothetical protein
MERLRAMSPQEVLFRLRRSIAMQVDRFPGLRASVPRPDRQALGHCGIAVPDVDAAPYVRRADKAMQHRLDVFALSDHFLGQPPAWNTDPKTGITAPPGPGKLIDYRDDRIVGNIKYLWEPSRHLQLPSLAQAYRLTGDRRYLDGLVRLLDGWMRQCPYPNGVHWCSALEVGIRLINWSFVWRIVGGIDDWRAAGVDDAFLSRWLDSIYRHLQFIDGYYSAYSSANNHLIGEAAGVYIGAVTWPGWKDVERWRCRAKEILVAEIDNQTWPDGVNAEQAIAYQQFVLDFFLIAGLAAKQAGDPMPDAYWNAIERMLQFLYSTMDVGGNVPMIGDADDGFVVDLAPEPGFCNYRSLLASGAILFGRSDFAGKAGGLDSKTRWLIEHAEEEFRKAGAERRRSPPPERAFPQGGYYVLGADLESDDEVRIVFDAGPLGMGSLAAHGHADALSFNLSVSGTPFLIDPGTYAYHTEQKWRDYFRGTSAHNTVRIDGLDQSVIGGNFMWKRHARATVAQSELGERLQVVDASHDGYERLDDPVTHRRRLILDGHKRSLCIEDHLQCGDAHGVEIFFHFPEYVSIDKNPDGFAVCARGKCLRIRVEHDWPGELFHGDADAPLGWISYGFDRKVPAYTLRYAGTASRSVKLVTNIEID